MDALADSIAKKVMEPLLFGLPPDSKDARWLREHYKDKIALLKKAVREHRGDLEDAIERGDTDSIEKLLNEFRIESLIIPYEHAFVSPPVKEEDIEQLVRGFKALAVQHFIQRTGIKPHQKTEKWISDRL